MMEMIYKREWMENYVLVPCEEKAELKYQEKMIEHSGEGFLKFSAVAEEGKNFFRYVITGMKSMKSVFEAVPLKSIHVMNILKGLIDVIEEGRELLLTEEGFVLDPDSVFMSLSDYSVSFMYLPGHEESLQKGMEKLFEFMLNRLDYNDEHAIKLLYECYGIAVKEEKGIEALKKRLDDEGDGTCEKETSVDKNDVTDEALQEDTEIDFPDEPENETWLDRLKDRFGFNKNKKSVEKTEEFAEVVSDFEEYEKDQGTVFMSVAKERKKCECIVSEKTGEAVMIEDKELRIGSAKDFNDCIIDNTAVSRIHAIIKKHEEGFFISDLNSTNGTYVNGGEVMPGEKVLLKDRDRIKFADEEYVYHSEEPVISL